MKELRRHTLVIYISVTTLFTIEHLLNRVHDKINQRSINNIIVTVLRALIYQFGQTREILDDFCRKLMRTSVENFRRRPHLRAQRTRNHKCGCIPSIC